MAARAVFEDIVLVSEGLGEFTGTEEYLADLRPELGGADEV